MQKVQVCVSLSILKFSQPHNLRKYDNNNFKKFSERNKNNEPLLSVYIHVLVYCPDLWPWLPGLLVAVRIQQRDLLGFLHKLGTLLHQLLVHLLLDLLFLHLFKEKLMPLLIYLFFGLKKKELLHKLSGGKYFPRLWNSFL